MSIEIITTADGSHSLLHKELNETYHSVHGALQESLHVFIRNGLQHYLDKGGDTPVRILELGFGTGLNALVTLDHASGSDVRVSYTSLEAFPLDRDTISQLNYPETAVGEQSRLFFQMIHDAPWDQPARITDQFILQKIHTTAQQFTMPAEDTDLIFFDAFAPSRQPELWEYDVLARFVNALRPGGIFVTYCARGQLKRDLRALGMLVETLPGPPGKKEMVRATKAGRS